MVIAASLCCSQDVAVADTFSAPGSRPRRSPRCRRSRWSAWRSRPTAGCSSGRRTASSGSSRTASLLPTPFIDLSAKVNTFDDRGFWGLAFDPNFATNGYVYMSYTYENAGEPERHGAATRLA